MKTLEILEARTDISVEPQIRKKIAGISDSSPKWVRDAIEERKGFGESLKFAITNLQRSPFFKDEWVIYE